MPNGSVSSANLRSTNPNLFGSLMRAALMYVALGFNFLLTTPTFEQFNIPKNVIGAGFLGLGVAFLVFLNVWRNLKAVRILLILGMFYMLFWGIGTTQTWFQGTSSLQLFVLYFFWALSQAPLLREPFFNPITANGVEK